MNPDANSNVFGAAVQWLQGTMLGTIATTVAVIAVASIGFLLLSGRIDMRRATQIIVGCFILFGASSIASGIVKLAGNDPTSIAAPPPPAYVPPAPAAPVKAVSYDPYAGAALPTQR